MMLTMHLSNLQFIIAFAVNQTAEVEKTLDITTMNFNLLPIVIIFGVAGAAILVLKSILK